MKPAEIKLLQAAYDYLAETDRVEPADYIYVFGAQNNYRIEKAVELYGQGRAPKLIVCGRGPFYGDGQLAEANRMAAYAHDHGVPEAAILIENKSITIPDNVRRALNLLDAQGSKYGSFILVNSPFSQRRGWCVFRKHTPDTIKLWRVNAETDPKFERENWYTNADGLRVVLGEFVKLRNTIAFNDA